MTPPGDPPQRKPSKTGAVVAVVLILLMVVFGYFARDFGLGGGGSGAAETAPQPQQAAEPRTDAPPVRVMVRGERCAVDGGEPQLCSAACEAVAQRSTAATPVDVDAAEGTHASVETLRRCLGLKGYKSVRVDAGESRGPP